MKATRNPMPGVTAPGDFVAEYYNSYGGDALQEVQSLAHATFWDTREGVEHVLREYSEKYSLFDFEIVCLVEMKVDE